MVCRRTLFSAQGNYAYCEVIRHLMTYTRQFRVLALSATPGSDAQAIQQVISNLLIAHMEVRTEDSLDVRPYIHGRQVRLSALKRRGFEKGRDGLDAWEDCV